ncbi:MAG: SMC-Scp complex subunit ScpB [Luteimonas sp.]|nr:SMC-Scp complex subunit ScpB [Luteimonas sp.]
MDQALVTRIVEAALLASNQPLTLVQLGGLFPLDEPAPDGSVQQALETLQADAAARGVELVEVASGWRYQVQADVHAWVARLWTERQTKYTRATLETLALIAYRQPITRGEIEQVRGVATNSNIIKALEEREWIRVVGHRDIPGRPELLGTTRTFLDYFGLKRLDELPPLSELKDFGELEPQFQFDGEARAVGGIAAEGEASSEDADLAANDALASEDVQGADAANVGTDTDEDTTAGLEAQLEVEAETDTHDADFEDEAADTNEDNALADDGDSTGARHE